MVRVIRLATPGDALELARVQIASFRAIYAGLMNPSVLAGLDAGELGRLWRGRVVDGPAVTLVSCEADHLLGYASLGPARDSDAGGIGELWSLYVAPEAWATGVGAHLLTAACEALAERGFPAAVLWVLEANRRARRFYEKHGFEVDGARNEAVEAGWILPHIRYRRVIKVDIPETSSIP